MVLACFHALGKYPSLEEEELELGNHAYHECMGTAFHLTTASYEAPRLVLVISKIGSYETHSMNRSVQQA